ncbi:aromatase/cyclase [Actinokineospora iranica]|uniref:Aromatase n=1 Tax=Actinokineospora iranica TaxID=1271860 RepID=A0A1G6S6A6_9PSEU|nr:aromatase/cyclase [Actinokineospora iranica]SDD12369.1 aromatase [Actinokineospora iranica]
MSEPGQRHMIHSLAVAAAPAKVYDLVAQVRRWPVIFEPTVHVRQLDRGAGVERFQIWALVNGTVKNWISRRTLDERNLSITFEQERSQAPVLSMGGRWSFRPTGDGRTEVVLEHWFTATDSDAVAAAVDHNSGRELAALGRVAEQPHPTDELVFTFTDRVALDGTAKAAYRFVNDSGRWPERLPHVGRVALREDEPGVQDMEMDTVTADGGKHTTRSIRLCFPPERIVYKQLVPPALLAGHAGAWDFADGPDGAHAVATHTVAINPAAIATVLGPDSTVDDARTFLRTALGANSRATLAHAAGFAERRS